MASCFAMFLSHFCFYDQLLSLWMSGGWIKTTEQLFIWHHGKKILLVFLMSRKLSVLKLVVPKKCQDRKQNFKLSLWNKYVHITGKKMKLNQLFVQKMEYLVPLHSLSRKHAIKIRMQSNAVRSTNHEK